MTYYTCAASLTVYPILFHILLHVSFQLPPQIQDAILQHTGNKVLLNQTDQDSRI